MGAEGADRTLILLGAARQTVKTDQPLIIEAHSSCGTGFALRLVTRYRQVGGLSSVIQYEGSGSIMSTGKKSIFALLWVIGVPFPILAIIYFLTSGGCN
jgi:hypothetical protein